MRLLRRRTEPSAVDSTARSETTCDSGTMRAVCGLFATGITVVSAGGARPYGMTANAFTSVSLDPPLVLVCLNRDTHLYESIMSAQSFAVSVLNAQQADVARHFAAKDRPTGAALFEDQACQSGPRTGAPLIRDARAYLECALWRVYDGGDHWIILGRVLDAGGEPGDALLFYSGQFETLESS